MENLWVRSQNKEKLTKVDNLGYSKYIDHNLNEYIFYIYCQNSCVLGEYKTKERCIEIIDEIQKLLLSNNPQNAFIVLENLEMDYKVVKEYIERARRDNFLAYHSGYDSSGEKGSIQFLQPSVLVYEMPKE